MDTDSEMLAELKKAYFSGARDVWIGNTRLTLDSRTGLKARIDELEAKIARTSGITIIHPTTSEGH